MIQYLPRFKNLNGRFQNMLRNVTSEPESPCLKTAVQPDSLWDNRLTCLGQSSLLPPPDPSRQQIAEPNPFFFFPGRKAARSYLNRPWVQDFQSAQPNQSQPSESRCESTSNVRCLLLVSMTGKHGICFSFWDKARALMCLPTQVSVPSGVTLNDSVWFRFCRKPVMRSSMKQLRLMTKHWLYPGGRRRTQTYSDNVSVINCTHGKTLGKCPESTLISLDMHTRHTL